MLPLDDDALPSPAPLAPSSSSSSPALIWLGVLLGIIVCATLLFNILINRRLLASLDAQGRRVARLENRVFGPYGPGNDPGAASIPGHPRRAGAEERIAFLLSVASDPERSRRVLEALSPEECTEVTQALIARPPANDRNAALYASIGWIARANPAQAFDLLGTLQEPLLRNSIAQEVVNAWTLGQPDESARWLAANGPRIFNAATAASLMLQAVTRWAAFDPQAAAQFVVSQPSGHGPVARALRAACRAWGEKDAAAALAWTRTLPPADVRTAQAVQGVWEGWTERNPAQASTALGQQLYGGGRLYAEVAGTVGQQWAMADPAAAAQWAQTLPAGSARRNALYQVAAIWTQSDAPGAARWAVSLPATAVRGAVWSEIASVWADADATGAGTWVSSLPLGRDHDEAVAAYSAKIEAGDPAQALALARTVSAPDTAAELVDGILLNWSRKDPEAARNWSAANGVPVPVARPLAAPAAP